MFVGLVQHGFLTEQHLLFSREVIDCYSDRNVPLGIVGFQDHQLLILQPQDVGSDDGEPRR